MSLRKTLTFGAARPMSNCTYRAYMRFESHCLEAPRDCSDESKQ